MGFQKKAVIETSLYNVAYLHDFLFKCIRYLISVVFPFLKITLPV